MEKKHLFSLRSLPIGKILLLFLLIYIALLAIPYIQHKDGKMYIPNLINF